MKYTGIIEIHTVHVPTARSILGTLGYRVFVLPPSGIIDSLSFFRAIQATIPLDPPVDLPVWDALDDSLRNGLGTLSDVHQAIIWPNALPMAIRAPEDFANARDVLTTVANVLADEVASRGDPRMLLVVIEKGDAEVPALR